MRTIRESKQSPFDASIYKVMPTAGVESLASFMREFKQKRG
jgi:phosphoserine aminotransferase